MTFEHDLKATVRTIPDYPKKGIMFRDITTLLGEPRAFRRAVDELVQPWAGQKIDKIAGIAGTTNTIRLHRVLHAPPERVYRAFLGPYTSWRTFFHGHTYTGNALACAVACASLRVFERDGVVTRVNQRAADLRAVNIALSIRRHAFRRARSGPRHHRHGAHSRYRYDRAIRFPHCASRHVPARLPARRRRLAGTAESCPPH